MIDWNILHKMFNYNNHLKYNSNIIIVLNSLTDKYYYQNIYMYVLKKSNINDSNILYLIKGSLYIIMRLDRSNYPVWLCEFSICINTGKGPTCTTGNLVSSFEIMAVQYLACYCRTFLEYLRQHGKVLVLYE